MSALGQKRTYAAQKAMSAITPKADICSALAHVCFGPIADMVITRRLATELLRLPRWAMPIFFVFLLRRKKLRRISRA
jgi:hypothetical protein